MRLTADRQLYDRLQCHILQQITDAVRGHLRLLLGGRVPADLNAVTSDIVFADADIIDVSAGLEDRGTPVIPVLSAIMYGPAARRKTEIGEYEREVN